MPNALVIDDNRQLADNLCRMLNLLGVSAEAAYGARTGLMRLAEHTPDIVFLDINMPGVDGFEVLKFLRRQPQLTDTTVVVITSDDQPETAQHAGDLGAVKLIVKPISIETLETALSAAGIDKLP